MKKLHITAILLILILPYHFFRAQDLSLNWSREFDYRNNKDGFFYGFIGSNDQYIYGMNMNLAITTKSSEKKIKLIAFDKEKVFPVASVALKGFKENEAKKETYKDLRFLETVVSNNRILVFWIKSKGSKKDRVDELYVESFTTKLIRDSKLKKIFTYKGSSEVKTYSRGLSPIQVMSNKEGNGDIIIGSELPQKDDNVEFNYAVLDESLELGETKTVDLPIKAIKNSYDINSTYNLGKDGKIYINSTVSMTKEERKKAKKGENLVYCVFSLVNPENGDLSFFEMRDENKRINDFSYVITEKGIRFYGFFTDLLKDPKASRSHGIFHSTVTSEDMDGNGINYTYFDKKTDNNLFGAPKNAIKKGSSKVSKSKNKKSKDDDEENILYKIEGIFDVDGNTVLFSSIMNNYSVTTCTTSSTGGQTCTTRYYCAKTNVFAIKINENGEIVWANKLDRAKTYSGTSVYDLKTVRKGDKFYCIYGSDYTSVENGGVSKKKRKKNAELKDKFEYAVFDYDNGKYEKSTFEVNKQGVTKKEKKFVNPATIYVFDDRFYVNHIIARQKIGWTVANIVVWPTLYYSMLSGDTKKAKGNLGVIKPL